MYEYLNVNSQGNFVNDCVIRALALAENKTWDNTYIELSILAKNKGVMLDDSKFVEDLLDRKYSRKCYDYLSVGDFALTHNKGTYLITMNGHITCCVDGIVYDSWDCRDIIMKCAWKVK